MKCSNCGFEVPDGAAFCEKCGWKKETELTEQSNKTPSEKQPFGETVKTKIHDFWNGLDFFCKIATVALTVAVLLFFGAMLWGNFCTVVISVLQIAGLIVALLMHKGKIKWGKEWTKYLILVLAIVFVFLNFSSYSWFESAEATIQENANVPVSAAECIGKNKTDVINNLRRAGFRNVHEETIADLEIADAAKDGVVEAISINGVSDFKGNEEFKKDAKVVVTYHTYKCVSMPFASKDIKNMEENEIYEALKEIGFISIETEEVFDLDPDTTDAECEYGLSINGTSVFEKNAEFPINAEVTIVTHRV